MDRITILLCLFCVSHVLCVPSTKLTNSSSVIGNVHDKRSIGSLLMPLLSGITSGDSGAGGGMLSLLGSLLSSQLAGGGGGGRGGSGNSRPVQDHFGAASNGGGRSMSAAVTSHRGPGLGFNLDLGRIGSNLISGFNAGRQFGNTGGALLGSFLQAGLPPQQQQQQQKPFQENHFSNGGGFENQQAFRGSGSPSFRQGNSLLPPPPQSFQDELPRDFHSRGRPNAMSPGFPPSPQQQPQQQIDFPSSVPSLNEFNVPHDNFDPALPPHSMAQQPQQQQFGNEEQQQVEQPPQFEENVSSSGETVGADNNEKRKPGQRSRKRKPTKSQVQIIRNNNNEQFPDSTGNRELSVPQNNNNDNNNNQNSPVINDQGSDPNFFNRPSPFADSSFNPQQQLQHQQQFQAAPNGPLPGDSSAFASSHFPTQMRQLGPNNMGGVGSQIDSARGPNYAHSVPLAFDQYGERFPGNGGEVWLTDEDEAADDASF